VDESCSIAGQGLNTIQSADELSRLYKWQLQ